MDEEIILSKYRYGIPLNYSSINLLKILNCKLMSLDETIDLYIDSILDMCKEMIKEKKFNKNVYYLFNTSNDLPLIYIYDLTNTNTEIEYFEIKI